MTFRTALYTSCPPLAFLPARSLQNRTSRRCQIAPTAFSEGKPPPGADKDDQKPFTSERKHGAKARALHSRVTSALSTKLEQLMMEVMPRERGDARDWALMWTSVAIFVYAAMHMYRLYAYAYYSLGLRPLTHLLGH